MPTVTTFLTDVESLPESRRAVVLRLIQWRLDQGLTSRGAAKALGVSTGQYARYERGELLPHFDRQTDWHEAGLVPAGTWTAAPSTSDPDPRVVRARLSEWQSTVNARAGACTAGRPKRKRAKA